MKTLKLLALGLCLGLAAAPAVADAQPGPDRGWHGDRGWRGHRGWHGDRGWHGHRGRRFCHWERYRHHSVRRCYWR